MLRYAANENFLKLHRTISLAEKTRIFASTLGKVLLMILGKTRMHRMLGRNSERLHERIHRESEMATHTNTLIHLIIHLTFHYGNVLSIAD